MVPENFDWDGLNDSKKLSSEQRARLSARIRLDAATGLGFATAAEIDASNILVASLRAMSRAVEDLSHAPDHILVDGNRLPDWAHAAEAVIGGDARAPSIAAASIIAKHARDEIMVSLDGQYPGYQWSKNKGYGVPAHREGLERQGVSPEHRRTFAPIRRLLEQS